MKSTQCDYLDHAADLGLEVCGVIYDVEVRVADPCCGCVLVKFFR
jgi:hypothetical protein